MDRQMIVEHLEQQSGTSPRATSKFLGNANFLRGERSGRNTTFAQEFLTVLEEMQVMHVADRDRLLELLTTTRTSSTSS
jgi:hypothetical protein